MADFAEAYQSLLRFLYRAPIAVVLAGIDGEIVVMTPAAAKLLVPLSAAAQRNNLFAILQPHVPQLATMLAQSTKPSGLVCESLRIDVRPEGGPPQVLSLSLIKLDGRELMAVIADVTKDVLEKEAERRQADQKLSELAASFDQALATMAIALAREDLVTGRVFPNERLREWLNVEQTPQGLTALDLLERLHPEDRAQYLTDRQLAISGHQAPFREFRVLRPGGGVRYVAGRRHLDLDRHGQAVRLTTFGVDVTEQRSAELERIAQADRLKLAVEAAGVGTFEIECRGRGITWSDQTYTLFGHEGPRADPKLVLEQGLTSSDLASFEQWVDSVFAGHASGSIEYAIKRVDGQSRWLALKGRLRRDANGGTVSMIGVIWDVTEHRRAAEALQALRVAEQANRAKTDFLSSMSHELRTPLNAILGFSELLLLSREPVLTASQRQQVAHVRDSGQHLLTLITDLLDVSLIEAGRVTLRMVEVDLRHALNQALKDTEAAARARGIRVLPVMAGPDAFVRADPARLRQVLLNLLTNAVKYNRQGGVIELQLTAASDCWRISVIDSGIGMTDTQLQRLFQPFDRLGQEKTSVEGTGIGLVITRQLTEAMHGRLFVRSVSGEGTRFDVELPASQQRPPPSGGGATDDEIVMRSDIVGRALAAEDNPVNATVLRSFLRFRPGVVLEVTESGRDCIDAAQRCPPDVVLLDMLLPDMLGTELLQRLREVTARRDLPCIFISASMVPHERRALPQTGRCCYLTKPLNLGQLLAEIDRVLGASGA